MQLEEAGGLIIIHFFFFGFALPILKRTFFYQGSKNALNKNFVDSITVNHHNHEIFSIDLPFDIHAKFKDNLISPHLHFFFWLAIADKM